MGAVTPDKPQMDAWIIRLNNPSAEIVVALSEDKVVIIPVITVQS